MQPSSRRSSYLFFEMEADEVNASNVIDQTDRQQGSGLKTSDSQTLIT